MKLISVIVAAIIATPLVAQVQPRLKVGVILPQSGSLSSYGQQTLQGAQLALKQLRVTDPKTADYISLIIEDSRSVVESAKDAAERLVQQKKVGMFLKEIEWSTTPCLVGRGLRGTS